jgi:hypothetical protein
MIAVGGGEVGCGVTEGSGVGSSALVAEGRIGAGLKVGLAAGGVARAGVAVH